MKLRFVVKFGIKFGAKGDIEALADARRALKNQNPGGRFGATS